MLIKINKIKYDLTIYSLDKYRRIKKHTIPSYS